MGALIPEFPVFNPGEARFDWGATGTRGVGVTESSCGSNGNTTGKAAGGGATVGSGGSDGGGSSANTLGTRVARSSRISKRELREGRVAFVK
jgi:hypothetical protein